MTDEELANNMHKVMRWLWDEASPTGTKAPDITQESMDRAIKATNVESFTLKEFEKWFMNPFTR